MISLYFSNMFMITYIAFTSQMIYYSSITDVLLWSPFRRLSNVIHSLSHYSNKLKIVQAGGCIWKVFYPVTQIHTWLKDELLYIALDLKIDLTHNTWFKIDCRAMHNTWFGDTLLRITLDVKIQLTHNPLCKDRHIQSITFNIKIDSPHNTWCKDELNA